MIVVCDTSPITNLLQIGQLDILKILFEQIVVPESVYAELVNYEDHKDEIESRSWIVVKSVQNTTSVRSLMKRLDQGEAEAILLAREISAELIILDERRGRLIAEEYGLKIIGLLGVLISAKRKGYIKELKPHLDKLVFEIGFRVKRSLYNRILKEVNEI